MKYIITNNEWTCYTVADYMGEIIPHFIPNDHEPFYFSNLNRTRHYIRKAKQNIHCYNERFKKNLNLQIKAVR